MAQYTQRTQPMHRHSKWLSTTFADIGVKVNDPKCQIVCEKHADPQFVQIIKHRLMLEKPGQTDHGHGGGTLAYGGKPGGVVPPQPRPPPAAPYAPQPYPSMRLHQPGYGSAALTYRESSYGRSGGAVGEYRAGSRMSILGTGYMSGPAPAQHPPPPPPADPPPFKKIRLTAERAVAPHQPLRVDTREPVNSYNTVEVLSPNPPSEPTVEEQSFRTTKDDLLQQISKVDREMALSDATLSKLRKKQEELEQTASKPAQAAEPEEAVPRHRSLAQCIYADNRKKATSAHAQLSHLGPPVLYPLYNQPQDTEVYHENIKKHRTFRRRLAEHIRRLKLEAEKREDALAEAYTRRAAEWMKRVERIEQGQKRKAKDARNREFFEKVFPELRKQREERERFNRLGARVKSEAELEEIADGLNEQEHEDKKMRALTVVPPLLRDPKSTTPIYIDTNRRCMDMESEHKELQLRNVWSQAEREVFRDKYLQHPKNFGQIASFLPRKSVRDCVRFYYLSKKAENYKQLLRKPRQRRSARNPPRPSIEPELPAGVTTRLQRSQGTVGRGLCDSASGGSEGGKEEDDGTGGIPVTCIPVPPTAPLHPARVEMMRTPPLPPSPPPASSAPPGLATSTTTSTLTATSISIVDSPAPPTPPLPPLPMEATTVTVTSADVTVTITAITTSASIPLPLPMTCSTSSTPSPSMIPTPPPPSVLMSTSPPPCTVVTPTASSNGSAPPTPQPAQPPTPTQPPPTPETAVIERTPSSTPIPVAATAVTTTVTTCAVCDAPGATRTVSRSRASHYGLKEDMVGGRVCDSCHSRCVVSRYTRCAVPRCGGPRVRARRLRHLPPRWHDLPMETKRPIMDEFQIPSDLSKCCLACFKRISRRLEAAGVSTEPSDDEVSRFMTLLKEHGTSWDAMASNANMEAISLKAFYFTYRKKYCLDAIVADRSSREAGRTSTDESLSSGSGDASGGEPTPARRRRDEYDSSATETADEESESPATSKALPPTSIPAPSISTITSIPPAPSPATITSSVSCVTSPAIQRNGPNAPQTVRDVVLNLIEISLTRDSQPPPIKPHQMKVSSSTSSRNESLATLSVVSSSHPPGTARSPQRPATITPLQNEPPPEGVMLLHISPRHERERQEPLLDLSVKRRHEAGHTSFTHPNKIYRNASEYPSFRAQSERESPTYNCKPKAAATPPRAALKPAATKGSITLGTPVEGRFEARRTPEPKAGSITAGTPVHGSAPPRGFEYLARRSPGGAYYAAASAAAAMPRPTDPAFSPNSSTSYSRSQYGMEQRQIIITDFITSQQMHGVRRDRPPSPNPHYYRREPAVSVIQRHYAPHPHPHPHPPPGHEAFTSLVDVASAATALPVPRGETKPEVKQQTQTHQQTHQQSHQQSHQQPHQQSHQSTHQQTHQTHQTSHQSHQTGHQTHQSHQTNHPSHQTNHPSHQTNHPQHQTNHPSHQTNHPSHQTNHPPLQTNHPPHQANHPPHQANHPPHQANHPSHQTNHPQHQTNHPSHQTNHPPHQTNIPQHQTNHPPHQTNIPQHQTNHPPHQAGHQQPHQQTHQNSHQAGPHHHDIRLRDMSHIQNPKYHPQQIQYQVLERRQAQYLERDRQIQLQQRRETERAMTAMQERHAQQQMEQQQQREHERQHMLAHSVANEERRASVSYSNAKHRALTPQLDARQKELRPAPVVSSAVAPAAAPATRTEGTLTAASLIDAIITHQISQTSERFPRDCEPANPTPERSVAAPAAAQHAPLERDEHTLSQHTTSFKLGDLASNIITRDFQSPTTSTLIHNNRFPATSTENYQNPTSSASNVPATSSDEWKRRTQENPKHAPFLEPVSPPDNHHNNSRGGGGRRYGCAGAGASAGAGGFTTAYDYVTTRIVEVMRSDADERSKQIPQFSTSYAFPYNALNVATPPDGAAPTAAPAPGPAAPPPPEPAPLMSAQYEPLSDED